MSSNHQVHCCSLHPSGRHGPFRRATCSATAALTSSPQAQQTSRPDYAGHGVAVVHEVERVPCDGGCHWLGDSVMVWLSAQNCPPAVELLQEHDARYLRR